MTASNADRVVLGLPLQKQTRLIELAFMHPRLLWADIAAAAVAVLAENDRPPPFRFELELSNVPNFFDNTLTLSIEPAGVSELHVSRLRRTYEASRIVELAAIAIAGLGLYHERRS